MHPPSRPSLKRKFPDSTDGHSRSVRRKLECTVVASTSKPSRSKGPHPSRRPARPRPRPRTRTRTPIISTAAAAAAAPPEPDSDEERELELSTLESTLFPPSPALPSALPTLERFPKTGSLVQFGRALGNTTTHRGSAFHSTRGIVTVEGETTEEESEADNESDSSEMERGAGAREMSRFTVLTEKKRERARARARARENEDKYKFHQNPIQLNLLPPIILSPTPAPTQRQLRPTISELTTGLQHLGSPEVFETLGRGGTSIRSGGREYEYEYEHGMEGDEQDEGVVRDLIGWDVQMISDSDDDDDDDEDEDENEERRVLELTIPLDLSSDADSESESDSNAGSPMHLPLPDQVRLTHLNRLNELFSPHTPSFGGERFRAGPRGGREVVGGRFGRLVCLRRRGRARTRGRAGGRGGDGGGDASPRESRIREALDRTRRTDLDRAGGFSLPIFLAERHARISYMNTLRRSRARSELAGVTGEWARGVLGDWYAALDGWGPFAATFTRGRGRGAVALAVEGRALGRVGEMEQERGEERVHPVGPGPMEDVHVHVQVHVHAETTTTATTTRTKRRGYTDPDHLTRTEPLYPEFIQRYRSRLSETEPRFRQLKDWQIIDRTWDARFAAQEEREVRRSLEQRRRVAERNRMREEAERRAREGREREEREAVCRAAQIVQWEIEARGERDREARERELRRSNPHPPVYPPVGSVLVQPSATEIAPPRTPARTPPQELPNYTRIEYGNRSPPPPPPYNATSGFELVEIDDLLFDDADSDSDHEDEDEDEDGATTGQARGHYHQLVELGGMSGRDDRPPPAPPGRMLTYEEMRSEQAWYEQEEARAGAGAGAEREGNETGGRMCVVM